jgi:thiosulfate/3-mercaptopyruvate sulfurtransferase
MKLPGALVSPEWLKENLQNPKLVVLEAILTNPMDKSHAPGSPGDPAIPGALAVDIEEMLADRSTPLPHMLLPPEAFEQVARGFGISRESVIVVYDRQGIFSSPRLRWNFLAMGHDQVAVLDGGLPAWIGQGGPTEPLQKTTNRNGDFEVRPRRSLVLDAEGMARALEDPTSVVLDARSEGRFYGELPEPREGLRSGHMPNALNLPFNLVLDQSRFRDAKALRDLFSARFRGTPRLVFSCGSGVTACIIALAAELAGFPTLAVYDGSWSEWGLPGNRPVESGSK